MGLDMYLTRKKYVGAEYEHRNVKGQIKITIGDKELPIDFNRVSYIEESVGYWRKANQIHNWFVEHCQDGIDNCRDAYVDFSQLKELLETCKKIKEIAILKDGKVENGYSFNEKLEKIPFYEDGKIIENAEEIEELLPTCEGCFFGNTQYNEWYMEDIKQTIKMLTEIIEEEEMLNELGFYSEFIYHSSW